MVLYLPSLVDRRWGGHPGTAHSIPNSENHPWTYTFMDAGIEPWKADKVAAMIYRHTITHLDPLSQLVTTGLAVLRTRRRLIS